MNESGSTIKSIGQQGQDVARKASGAAQNGIQSAHKAADQALVKMSSKVDEVRDQAAPVMDKVSDQAQKLLQQGREVFNDTSKKVRDRVTEASDMAVGYTKDEPVKAMLIAAAAGALLMALVPLMARSRD